MKLPLRMRDRPRDARGYRVPFVQFIDRDGVPDFRIIDDDKLRMCLNARLCGLCGRKMSSADIYFVGGPL